MNCCRKLALSASNFSRRNSRVTLTLGGRTLCSGRSVSYPEACQVLVAHRQGPSTLLQQVTLRGFGVQAQSNKAGTVVEGMEKHGVVPDVINVAPNGELSVNYEKVKADLGNVLTPTQVQHPPQVSWAADKNKFYFLSMVDPDAPSRKDPKFREWHHWLVGNIPGSAVEQGEVLNEYVGAGPPQGTGLHRYVFLIYEQPGKLTFTEKKLTNRSGDGRGKCHIGKLAEHYKLGNPIAGNLFQAEWDDYVPKLYKQLGS